MGLLTYVFGQKEKKNSTKIKLKMWLFSILEQKKNVKNNCNFTKISQSGQSVGGLTEGYNSSWVFLKV